MNPFFSVHAKTIVAISTAILISACGGNNDNQSSTQNAVAIPESITISAPPVADLADALVFTNSAASQSGLKFAWNFGDGTSSNEATPKHRFSKVGDYEVSLIISNAAGNSKESKIKISVNNLAGVRGLACSGASDTGWCWQEPKPSGNWTNAFTLANATTGWRVGDAGDIFKTQDGGVSWQRQQSGVSVNLYQIHTYDDKIAWVIGANKTLLHTLDGGASWKELVSPVDVSSRFETDIVTVISAKSLLLTTSTDSYLTADSGLTWDKLTSPFNSKTGAGIIYGVHDSFLVRSTPKNRNLTKVLKLDDGAGRSPTRVTIGLAGENVVLVRGRTPDLVATNVTYYGKSLAWRSEDAGEHWTPYTVVGLPVGSENSKLYSLDKDGKVWLTQSAGGTYRSDDGGLSWREQESLRYGYGGPEDLGLQFVLVHGSRIFLISSWGGWKRYSDDFGKTWTTMKLPVVGESTIATILDAKLVNGVLILWDVFTGRYVSTDYGDNWKQVVVENRAIGNGTYHAVAFADAKNGVTVDASGKLKTSNDGGKTWSLKDKVFPVGDRLQPQMQFVTPATAYMLWRDGLIYKSRDGGATWLPSGPSVRSTNFGFFDEKNGWADIGITTWPISITRDGGISWKEVTSPYYRNPINSVWLDITSTLTIATDEGFISQLDSTGWQQRQTGSNNNLRKLYSFDTKTMWAIGDKATVLRSDDAGLNWKTVPVPGQVNLTDIQFVDTKNGWIVGQKGFILVTQDGGMTWKQQVSGTNVDLLKVQFVDIKTGWIIGADSTLLATGTGGF